MDLDLVCEPELPRLAWLAVVERDDPTVRILHGAWVETGDDFFFEGAWASDFGQAAFDDCETVMGSGGRVRDDRLVFCPPSHTLARLHVLRQESRLLVSNSFVFCLAASGRRLRGSHALYFRDFQSIVRGLRKHRRWIPLDVGAVEVVYADNVGVAPDLEITRLPKRWPPPFGTYAEYLAFLEGTVKAIGANVRAGDRSIRYEPIATMSSGYDSTASAVLSRTIHCNTAITFPTPRFGGGSDSGADNAATLGFSCVSVDRLAYRQLAGHPEAEFIATGTAADGGDLIFAPLGELLARKLLVTGFHGDGIWGLDGRPNRVMLRGDTSGSVMEEFRLRVGFVHLPAPFIAGVRNPEVRRISRAREMHPWVGHTGYVRPIARRIGEEAGLARESFGVRKKAVGARLFEHRGRGPRGLSSHLGPESARDYERYHENRYARNRQEILYSLAHAARTTLVRATRAFNRFVGSRLGLPRILPDALGHYDPRIGRNWLLFHWAVEKTLPRYAAGFSQRAAAADPWRPGKESRELASPARTRPASAGTGPHRGRLDGPIRPRAGGPCRHGYFNLS